VDVKNRPRALVITGYGINCDYETKAACMKAGFESERVHLNDVIENNSMLFRYKLVVIPGGFSFGDDLGSGVAFAAKTRFSVSSDGTRLYDALMEYVERDGLLLGICNGFQILVRLGLIPAVNASYGIQQVTLAPNREGYFIDRWVYLKVEGDTPNIFTRGITRMRLPVRHGEGRFLAQNPEVMNRIEKSSLVSMRYCDPGGLRTLDFPQNPNGSENAVAGLCNPSGRIFGLMPHPEAAITFYHYPDWTRVREEAGRKGTPIPEEGEGYYIFQNACDYVH
jgi:phosphoribosylformylglycinamidine synthase